MTWSVPRSYIFQNPNPPNNNENNENMEEIISRIYAQQCRIAISQILDRNANIGDIDQVIEERCRHYLADLDKVPDVVKERNSKIFCSIKHYSK